MLLKPLQCISPEGHYELCDPDHSDEVKKALQQRGGSEIFGLAAAPDALSASVRKERQPA
jgi:hypothetical protein